MKKLTLITFTFMAISVFSQTKKRTKVERLNISNEIMFNSSLCEQSYYSIKLAGFDIGLDNDKKWWGKYEPILFIELETDDQKFYQVFGSEVGAPSDNPKSDNGFRTSQNILLIGPYPFKGDNSVKVKVKLYAAKVEDKIQNVIGAVTPITEMIGGQAEMFSNISTEVANHISGLLSNYKPLTSFEGEWNPYNGNTNDKNLFRSGHFIIHSIEDENKFDYSKISIGDDGQIEYFEKGRKSYLFQKNVDYAILEFEHQLYRTDISTSKFSYYSHLADALKESTGGRDTIKIQMLFEKFKQNLLDDNAFTYHDKVRLILEKDLQIISQIKVKYPTYVSKNIVTPFCTDELYKSLNSQKTLTEMTIRKSLIDNNLISAGQTLDSIQYHSLISSLPSSSRPAIVNKLKSIGFNINENSLDQIESILSKVDEPLIDEKSTMKLIRESQIQIQSKLNDQDYPALQQQQQQVEYKIDQIRLQQIQHKYD